MTYGPGPGTPPGPPPPDQSRYPPAPGYGLQEPAGWYMGHRLADWGVRAGAYLLDSLFVAGPTIALALPLLVLLPVLARDRSEPSGPVLALLSALIFAIVALQIGLVAYNRWYLQGKTGQSWGKRILHLRLVRMADGQPVGGGMAFVRDLAHTVDGLVCYVGWLWPLWDDRRQTLADKMLSTVVLDERR
jgi:uncharacterized RDD family membrane protein YckC